MRKLTLLITMLFLSLGMAWAQELLVNCDYNSSTEGWGTTKFSNYAGAYAYAAANAKNATIVIEKTNTLSGNTFDNNHKNYSKLAVVIKDGATMGNAASKWDMTYPVTVEPGGTLTCARPASASVSNIHIKNKLIVGAKGATKKAYVNFLSDSYQDCDISIRYNGSIEVYNADFYVQDLDAQGKLTIEDSKVEVDGAFASATSSFYPTTLTNSTITINGNLIDGGLSDFSGGTSNQLGNVKLNNSTLTIKEGDTKVAAAKYLGAPMTATNSTIAVNNLTVADGATLNLNEGSTLEAENITTAGTGSVKIDGVQAEISGGQAFIPVAKIGEQGYETLAAALEATKTMTGDVTVEILDKVTFNQPLIGNYTSINFVGKDTDAEMYLDVQGYITATGKKVSFTDLKLSKSEGGFITNAGFMNVAFGIYDVEEVTYNNCTFINGACASSGDVTFNGCTFYRSHDRYGLWAYGAPNVVVDGCTFADIRGIKLWDEGKQKLGALTVKNTDFSAVDGKPAIVLTSGKSVTLAGNTYNTAKGALELDLDGNPNGTPVTSDVTPVCVNDNGACGVLVDGKIYTTVAQAAEVASSGSTVTLLHNSAETVELAEGVVLDKNGFEAAGVTVYVKPTVAKIGDTPYYSLAEALEDAKTKNLSEVVITIIGENTAATADKFNLYQASVFNKVTFKQENGNKPYYFEELYTGSRTDNGQFVFDGVNLVVTGQGQYIFEGNVVLSKNSLIKSTAEANCFVYNAEVTVEAGSKIDGVIEDIRGGSLIIDGGKTDGTYCEEPGLRDAILVVNWVNSNLVLRNGAYVNINAANEIGRLTVNGTLDVANSKLESYQWIQVNENGTMKLKAGSDITTNELKGNGNITIDATDMAAGDVVLTATTVNFTGTLSVINNDKLEAKIVDGKIVLVAKPVAKIGEQAYATLEAAFAAATEGQTITMLDDATPALTSQRAITKAAEIDLGGKTLTLTEDDLYFGTTTFKNGTIVVDPSVKPSTAVFWMFANQTLTFDNVKIVATGVTGTYLIGLDGNNSDLNLLNGSEILVENTTALDLDIICVNASTGNDIKVENSKVNVTNLDGRVFFRGNYTVKDSEVNLAGITKAGFRIEAGQTLSIEGTSSINIQGEPRDGGIHLTDATSTYTKAETATVNATVNAPAPAYVAKIGEHGYATLSEALAAVTDDAQTVVVLRDVTENLTGAYLRGNITTENGAKVTITLTNSDWVYCPYTFVIGENVTLKVPALFYYAGGSQINGTVVAGAYYQRYAGTKLTINEPGSMTVTSETCIIRLTDGDANAGIYINGDNNDETIGLNLAVAYFYQGMINAKNANIKAGTYWQTNETDGQGSANLVLDNSKLVVSVYDHPAKATGNSTVTLTNGSVIDAKNGGFTYGDDTTLSVDATSKIIGKNGALVELPVAKIGEQGYATLAEAIAAVQAGDNTIELLADCAEKVTIAQVNGTNIVINGNGKTYTGTITVKGDGASNNLYNTETLTFQNINFTPASGKYAIAAVKNTFARNITVDGCTFKGNNDVYGIDVRHGYNYTVKNTTAEGVYTFLNARNALTGLTVENVTVKCANVAFAGAYGFGDASFKKVTVESDNNGVKVNNPNSSALTFENCSITAKTPVTFIENAGVTSALTAEFNGTNNMVVSEGGTYWFNIVEADATAATFKAIVNDAALDMSNTAFAASVGNVYYSGLQKAIDVAVDGNVVTLAKNIELDAADCVTNSDGYSVFVNVAGKAITIDLNGKAITANLSASQFASAKSSLLMAVFSVDTDGNLTLNDNVGTGKVSVTANDASVYSLISNYDKSAKLTINGGSYELDAARAKSSLIHSDPSEAVVVNGGNFYLGNVNTGANGSPWIFNVNGNNTGHVTVNGGTFNYDVNHQYWAFEVHVDKTSALEDNGNGTWTVVPAVAYVNEKNSDNYTREVGYATIEAAVAAAPAGETVVVIKDVEVVSGTTITLDNVNLSTLDGVTLTNNGVVNVKGEVSLNIVALAGEELNLLDGAIVKNSTVGGSAFVAGAVTFRGANTFAMLYDYGTLTDYYDTTAPMKWIVEEGASVTLTDKARYGLGYGDNVTVNGNIENALAARETVTEADRSLFVHGLVAQESKGWNCNSAMTVKDAYVLIGSNNSFGNKPGNYGGTYTFNFENSVVDASRITFYEALSTTTFTFDGCDVKMGTFMTRDADSKFTLKNSKVLSTTTTNGNDEGNYNKGELTLVNSSLTYSAELKHEAGVINLDCNSVLTAPSISGAGKITVDATGLEGSVTVINGKMANFTGTIEIVGNDYAKYEITAEGLVINSSYIAEYVIDDTNPVDFENDSEKNVGTLTYKRTFVNGVWNALYLPFQVPVEELVENYDIAYYNQMLSYDSDNDGAFDSYEMEVAYLTSGTLRANYPYFIRPKNADACELEYVAEDVTLYPAVENKIVTSSVSNTFTLAGTHKAMSEAELDGYYAISYAGRWEGSTGLKPNRLYLKIENNNNSPILPAAAKSVSIVVRGEGGTTSIESVDGVNGATVIFDLQGRRVLEPQKGSMYIINGKKVIY